MENWCVDANNPRLIRQAQPPGHGVAKARATHTGDAAEIARFIAVAPETARKLAEAEARIAELEKMRSEAIRYAKSVMQDDQFAFSDWVGMLEILE